MAIDQQKEQEILRLLAAGLKVEDVATISGVTTDVIYWLIRSTGKAVGIALKAKDGQGRPLASMEIDKRRTISEQMWEINTEARQMLRRAKRAKDEELTLKILREIRRQLESVVKIETQLYTLKDVMLFQRVVLEAVAAASPEMRVKIESEFAKRRALSMIGMDDA